MGTFALELQGGGFYIADANLSILFIEFKNINAPSMIRAKPFICLFVAGRRRMLSK